MNKRILLLLLLAASVGTLLSSCKKDEAVDEQKLVTEYIEKNNYTTEELATGLYMVRERIGTGTEVDKGAKITVSYIGSLLDDKIFDSSDAFSYTVGTNRMIQGWEIAIPMLRENDNVILIMTSDFGYGANGSGASIPGYSPLVFNIVVKKVEY